MFSVMNILIGYGVNQDLRASEFERCLTTSVTPHSIQNIRAALFSEAKAANLASDSDILVNRKKTNGGKSVKEEVSDIWQLVRAITDKPRTLLRNGKRCFVPINLGKLKLLCLKITYISLSQSSSQSSTSPSQSRQAEAILSQDHLSNGTIPLSQSSTSTTQSQQAEAFVHSPNREPPWSQSSSHPSTTESKMNTATGDSYFRSYV